MGFFSKVIASKKQKSFLDYEKEAYELVNNVKLKDEEYNEIRNADTVILGYCYRTLLSILNNNPERLFEVFDGDHKYYAMFQDGRINIVATLHAFVDMYKDLGRNGIVLFVKDFEEYLLMDYVDKQKEIGKRKNELYGKILEVNDFLPYELPGRNHRGNFIINAEFFDRTNHLPHPTPHEVRVKSNLIHKIIYGDLENVCRLEEEKPKINYDLDGEDYLLVRDNNPETDEELGYMDASYETIEESQDKRSFKR